MSDPRPWRQDRDAPDAMRRDLQRVAEHPPAFDQSAGLRALRRGMATGRLMKVAPWFALVGLGAIGAVALWPEAPAAPPPEATSARSPMTRATERVAPEETTTHVAGPDVAVPSQRAPALRVAVDAAVSPPQEPARPISVAPGRTFTTQDEIAHMARLRSVAASDPEQALRLAREGSRRFPNGLFEEEREAIRILMLVEVGKPGRARRRGVRFLRHYPQSAFVDRIRALSHH